MTTIFQYFFEYHVSSLLVALLILHQHQLFHSHHEKSAVALHDMAFFQCHRDIVMVCCYLRLPPLYPLDLLTPQFSPAGTTFRIVINVQSFNQCTVF